MHKDHLESNMSHITEHLAQDNQVTELVEFDNHYEYVIDTSKSNGYRIGQVKSGSSFGVLEYKKVNKVW